MHIAANECSIYEMDGWYGEKINQLEKWSNCATYWSSIYWIYGFDRNRWIEFNKDHNFDAG